jgi:hypothetical protein
MAPCGKSKCDCGCKKKKAVKRKAPVKRRPLPQRGSNIVPSYPGAIQQQFMPSLETPIPSAVSKITGDRMVKKFSEIGTQTDESYFDQEKIQKLLKPKKEPKPKKERKITEGVLEPVEVSNRGYSVVRRARSMSKPPAKATNVPGFVQAYEARQQKMDKKDLKPKTKVTVKEPVEQIVEQVVEQPPGKVEDIKPRRGRPPGPKALGKNILPGVQKAIQSSVSSVLQAPQK